MNNLFGEQSTQYLGIREFARLVNVSDGAIRKAIKLGRLTVEHDAKGRPRLPEEKALAEWQVYHPETAATENAGDREEKNELAVENIRLTRAKADKAELELAELREVLHHSDDIRAVWEPMLANFKARMLAIAPAVTPMIVGLTDKSKIDEIISQKINEALTELSEYDPRKLHKAASRRRRKAPQSDE